jgi:hypothetical protein
VQAVAPARVGAAAAATTPYSALLPAFVLGGLGMSLALTLLAEAVMGAVARPR